MQTQDTKYNGWTNYATWRVNLELFDGFDVADYAPEMIRDDDAYTLSKLLEEYALDFIGNHVDDKSPNGTVEGWARAFLSDVNWYEIATHLLDDIKAEAT